MRCIIINFHLKPNSMCFCTVSTACLIRDVSNLLHCVLNAKELVKKSPLAGFDYSWFLSEIAKIVIEK